MQIHQIGEEWSTVKVGSKSENFNKPGYFEAPSSCCVPFKTITFYEVRVHVWKIWIRSFAVVWAVAIADKATVFYLGMSV